MVLIKATALAAAASLISSAAAHSWIEQLMVINGQGTFTGTPGYARNATARTTPGFSDPLMVHILPGQGQPAIEERDISKSDTEGVTPTDPMCKKTQQGQVQGSGLPRLSAPSGSMIALRYQENGHVTLPQNQPGKPPNRGSVYIYGTTQPKATENFLDVFGQWTADGSGGDKRGKLIATQPYDDGQCYQVNGGNISEARQKQYPTVPDSLMGADLWCQNDIKLPSDAVSGKPYTIYWVWDWPTVAGADPNLPKGKAELYTTCMDIDITAASGKRDEIKARSPEPQASGSQGINNAAIPSYMSSLKAAAATPAAASAPAPSAPAPAAPAASAPAASAPAAAAPPAPPASSVPAAPAASADAAMNPSLAAAIVESALAPEISSLVNAKGAGATVTVTPKAMTVTVTAGAVASSAPAQVSHAQPVSSSVAAAASVQPAAAVATPPASMNIQAPVLDAASAPAGTPSASVGVVSEFTLSATFSGTAYPASAASSVAPAASAPAPPGSSASAAASPAYAKCKKAKRSRILRRAVDVQELE